MGDGSGKKRSGTSKKEGEHPFPKDHDPGSIIAVTIVIAAAVSLALYWMFLKDARIDDTWIVLLVLVAAVQTQIWAQIPVRVPWSVMGKHTAVAREPVSEPGKEKARSEQERADAVPAEGPRGFKAAMRRFLDGNGETHIQKKKHRMMVLFILAAVLIQVSVVVGLFVGPTHFSNVDIMNIRLPRLLTAIGVGIGLSVAGVAYQAVIRNPLVDPYIMGVSSGAGTMAIAVIAFDFTFFGLFPQHSVYLTAASAIVGGLVAFGLTMLLAQRAGATTNAYVLSGVVVGLVFGAVQSIMLVFQGNNIANSLLWLFGSFKDVTWTHVPMVIIPTILVGILILRYSKELNLVLLGENQASQMGLNVKKFNALILILASVLTAFCVAFVGIIGFVGLVVPHLCRMLFGGDHRLVLPASIALGGVLMVLADLLARMILPGQELPVGAITTMIGVPVFAYLLIKKGKIYNG